MTTAEEYNDKGEELCNENKYEEAIADYSELIELDPDDDWAYSTRGDCYKKLEQFEKAIIDYTKAIELNPDDEYVYLVYLDRGDCYKELQRYEEANADYKKVLELTDDEELIEHIREEFIKMSEALEKSVEADERLLNTLELMENGNFQEAIEGFSKFIKSKPNDKNVNMVYSERGDCYKELEQFEEAIKDYKKALELTDDEEHKNYLKDTIELLESQVILAMLDDAKKCINKNDYCQKREKFQEALADYSEKAKTLPEVLELGQLLDKESLIMKVEALIENKDTKMLETYKKELSELPESELCLLKAEVYFMKGNAREVLSNFLIACIYDKSKYEEVTALIREWFSDVNKAIKLEKSLASMLAWINDSPLSTKEKIEYCKDKARKEVVINVDTISNIYVNAKAGRKLDF